MAFTKIQYARGALPDGRCAPCSMSRGKPAENVQNGQELMDRVRVTAKAVGAPMVGVNNVGAVGGNTGTPGHESMGVGNTYCGFSSWADKTGKTMAVAVDRDVDLAFWTIDTNKR
eukprot:SAG31_NODE_1746_length_7364_cov_6.205231_2_plen_115_part_00